MKEPGSSRLQDAGSALPAGPAFEVRYFAALLLLSSSTVTWAQDNPPAQAGDTIIVQGVREVLEVPPERSLNEQDIGAYGLGTVGEFLDEVSAETGENRDDPVFLVNGERVTDLDDVEDFPTEALERVDILPTGSASKVGASSTRRVYNVILKRNVDAIAARALLRAATEGGWAGQTGDVSYTRVRSAQRLNLAARIRHEGLLRESERDIEQPADAVVGLAHNRSLRPELRGFDLKVSAADRLKPWLQGSISGKLDGRDLESLLGLVPTTDLPRRRDRETLIGNLNAALNADVGSWLITFLGNYDYGRTKTLTDRIDIGNPLAIVQSRTTATNHVANADLVATGPLFNVPAGPIRGTVGAGIGRDSINSSQAFQGVESHDTYVQWTPSLSAGIEIPLASREKGFLPQLGELVANAELTHTRVTDFGWFTNQTYSLQWQPAEWVRLFGSLTTGKTPPEVGAIADPIIETPDVRYFDPISGQTVDVTEISGGNPDLEAQHGENRRLSLNIKPAPKLALQLFADYYGIRNRDIVTALPSASELILDAFPERFIRDPDGVLRIVDVRPVTFARQDEDRLRYGFNLMLPLAQRNGTRAGGPRLQVNAAHTWITNSEILIRSGFSPVDLLSPNAVGLGGSSRPTHQFDLTLGYAERGFGIRLNGRHRGKSYLNLVTGPNSDALRFSPLTTINLRAFAVGERLGEASWLKGTRITVSALNLTNDRQTVRDSAGNTPLNYQRDYLDPLGRTVQVEIRKLF